MAKGPQPTDSEALLEAGFQKIGTVSPSLDAEQIEAKTFLTWTSLAVLLDRYVRDASEAT